MLKTVSRKNDLAIENAYQAELRGDYREGLEFLRFFWDFNQPHTEPDKEFEKHEYADLLLRVGALYGFFGNSKPQAQEISKNLLTVAYQLFDSDIITDKCASCSNYMALTYLRMGATNEASLWLMNALVYDLEEDHPFRLHSHIVQSLIDTANSEFEKSLKSLQRVAYLFEQTSSVYLKACFYTNLAIVQKELNRYPESLSNFERAVNYFSKLNNRRYLSYIENNLALVHKNLSNFDEAFFHAEKSLRVCESLNDYRQMGCVYDTFAQIALSAENYQLAVNYSDKAIKTLNQTENYGFMVEARETKIRSLIKLKNLKDALLTFGDGLEIARSQTSPEIVSGFTERVSKMFEERTVLKIYQESGLFSSTEILELNYPENYQPPTSVIGIEVMSNRLQSFGLAKGCLAIVEEDSAVKNGDLISIFVPQTGSRVLGALCFFEDMILLEFDENSTPISFMRDEIKLIGKVIGYCNLLPDADGKVFVKVLEKEI